MTGLLGLPRRLAVAIASADLIITSRVTHHIDGDALAAFYRQAAAVLRPGGWLADVRPGVRPDAWDKATGGIRYNADLPVPAGTLEAVLVRSPFPHAQVTGIAAEEARAVPGVVAVVTAADLPGGLTGRRVRDMPLLASGVARFAGEPVAVVLAQSRTPRKLRRPWSMSITRSEPRSPMRWPRSARTARWSTRRPGSTRARSLPRPTAGTSSLWSATATRRRFPVRSPGQPRWCPLRTGRRPVTRATWSRWPGWPSRRRTGSPGSGAPPSPRTGCAARAGPDPKCRPSPGPGLTVRTIPRPHPRARPQGPAGRALTVQNGPGIPHSGPGACGAGSSGCPSGEGQPLGQGRSALVDRCHLVGHRR